MKMRARRGTVPAAMPIPGRPVGVCSMGLTRASGRTAAQSPNRASSPRAAQRGELRAGQGRSVRSSAAPGCRRAHGGTVRQRRQLRPHNNVGRSRPQSGPERRSRHNPATHHIPARASRVCSPARWPDARQEGKRGTAAAKVGGVIPSRTAPLLHGLCPQPTAAPVIAAPHAARCA